MDLAHLQFSGDFIFISPSSAMYTRGVHLALKQTDRGDVGYQAHKLLQNVSRSGVSNPILVGAIPFSEDKPYSLHVPKIIISDELEFARKAFSKNGKTGCIAATALSVPSEKRYCDNVAQAVEKIKSGSFNKVVLSRSIKINVSVNISELLGRLIDTKKNEQYVFGFNLPPVNECGSAKALVGASPELLVRRSGRNITSIPLAGSVSRGATPSEDSFLAKRLLQSTKNLHEHSIVAEAVAETLRPFCRSLNVPKSPSLFSTSTMWHLGTKIEGEIVDSTVGSLDLALALHPTPAVCGQPPCVARHFIGAVEGFDRNYFAGLIGWCNLSGDGEWAVTIRCAEIEAESVTLYAGAGIVGDSIPHAELQETDAKLKTMLNAMNLRIA